MPSGLDNPSKKLSPSQKCRLIQPTRAVQSSPLEKWLNLEDECLTTEPASCSNAYLVCHLLFCRVEKKPTEQASSEILQMQSTDEQFCLPTDRPTDPPAPCWSASRCGSRCSRRRRWAAPPCAATGSSAPRAPRSASVGGEDT